MLLDDDVYDYDDGGGGDDDFHLFPFTLRCSKWSL